MCLGIPMKVIEFAGHAGVVESGGVRRKTMLDLCPEARVGDWVIVHAGFAIHRMDEAAGLEP